MPNDLPPLLYADSERSADALYFGRINVPDPFLAFRLDGKKCAVVSALEFGRFTSHSDFDRVLPLEPYLDRARKIWRGRQVGAAEAMILVAGEFRIRRFKVPSDFPAALLERLRKLGLRLDVSEGPLFPSRLVKTAEEAEAIRQGNRASARGFAAAEALLRASRIRGGRLWHRGRQVTSERVKFEIESACLEAGAVSLNTIVAGGDQACDPHQSGFGPLRPNELIVLDVFPRVSATGYYGDMTRTFLKGRASDAQRRLVAAVRKAQGAALSKIRAGVDSGAVHSRVVEVFDSLGYATGIEGGRHTGFFHGTGHGVGLDIHEPPRMSARGGVPLRAGTVVTVEPGLYYPGLGGCRIEDVVQVTRSGCRMLSNYHYRWELP